MPWVALILKMTLGRSRLHEQLVLRRIRPTYQPASRNEPFGRKRRLDIARIRKLDSDFWQNKDVNVKSNDCHI